MHVFPERGGTLRPTNCCAIFAEVFGAIFWSFRWLQQSETARQSKATTSLDLRQWSEPHISSTPRRDSPLRWSIWEKSSGGSRWNDTINEMEPVSTGAGAPFKERWNGGFQLKEICIGQKDKDASGGEISHYPQGFAPTVRHATVTVPVPRYAVRMLLIPHSRGEGGTRLTKFVTGSERSSLCAPSPTTHLLPTASRAVNLARTRNGEVHHRFGRPGVIVISLVIAAVQPRRAD